MKSVSRNKFLTCFRPVDEKNDTKNSAAKSTFSEPNLTHYRMVSHPPKRTFSKDTRARHKNLHSQTHFASKRGYLLHTETSSSGVETQVIVDTKIEETKASESKNLSKCESTKEQLEKQEKFHCLVVKLFLMSLAVTVLWGKINVIMLTSMLLCLFFLWKACCLRLKVVSTVSKSKRIATPK